MWMKIIMSASHSKYIPFSKFIKDKYDYDDTNAAYIAGTVYDVSLVLSPFLGGLIVSLSIFSKLGIF